MGNKSPVNVISCHNFRIILQVQVLVQLEAPGQLHVCVPSGICAHVDKQESVGVSWASTPNRRKGQSGPMRVHVQSWVTLPKGICQPWPSHGLEGNLKNLFKDTSKPRALLWFGKVNREGLCLPTFTGNSVSDIRPLGPGNVMVVFLSLSPTPQFLTALILLYRLSIQPFIQKLY